MSEAPTTPDFPAAQLIRYLQRVTQALAAVRTHEAVFAIVLQDALDALGGIGGAILLVQDGGLQVVARRGQDDDSVWQDGDLSGHRPSPDALRSNTPLFFSHHGDLTAAYPELEAHTGGVAPVASAVLPMVEEGRPLGTIVLNFKEPHDFTAQEKDFLLTLAAQCALALDRAQLFAQLNLQLQIRSDELGALVRFVEAISGERDVLVLARRAVEILGVLFPECTCGYYAAEDEKWKLRVHTPELEAQPHLLSALQAGVPLEIPVFFQAWRTGQASFVDAWDYREAGTEEAKVYQTVASYPLVVQGQTLAMFGIGLKHTRQWSAHGRAVFLAVARSLDLALERADQVQQLEAESRAREAFATFMEAVGTATDVKVLARQAIEVLRGRFPQASVGYYEREGERWKARLWTDDVSDEVLAVILAGVPAQLPFIAEPLRTRQPVFTDAWDPHREQLEHTDEYGMVGNYPLIVDGQVEGILSIGLRHVRQWHEADKALVRSVGHGLTQAMERTATSRQLERQNAELNARTQALEGFAALTRELGLSTDRSLLIERALQLVMSLLPNGYALFWQVSGTRWHLAAQVGDVGSPELQAVLQGGLPVGQASSLDEPYQTREPLFQDQYDRTRDVDPALVEHVDTVATLPVMVNGSVSGIFTIVLFAQQPWNPADRAVLLTAAQSLGLALERAEQARELIAQRDMLKASNEELEAFTYSVSHDLRTPVRHIASFMELLRRTLPEPLGDKAARYFRVIEDAAQHLSQLIDGMLELSRTSRQAFQPEQVDLNRLVDAVQRELGSRQARRITWKITPLPTVIGDAVLLRRVVTALLDNAVKYTRGARRP